jgi:formylglycine-generating enzyme required for sulfatase activity
MRDGDVQLLRPRVLAPLALCVLVAACTPAPLPALGEALFVVDTDMPVPRLVSRLRADTYAADGTWIDSRDVSLPQAGDWPASFSVYAPNGEGTVAATVRLRAYGEGLVRDYRGESYVSPPPPDLAPSDVPTVPAPDGTPRLLVGGVDQTPPTEPLPSLAIDQIVPIRLRYGTRASVRLVLAGACAGIMADIEGGRTCAAGQLVTAAPPVLDVDLGLPAPSALVGTFGVVPEPAVTPRPGDAGAGTPLYDEEVAVAGGPFVLGGLELADYGTSGGISIASTPLRLAVVSSFVVDRYEVTVARWRDALARGFVPPAEPYANDAPMPSSVDGLATPFALCTYSTQPLTGSAARESYPVTCVTHAAAQAFCRFEGGDLLSEAEWEYVAGAWDRPAKTPLPWGTGEPSCMGVVYGRVDDPSVGSSDCYAEDQPVGPQPVTAAFADLTATSASVAVMDLGGNVKEWTRDDYDPYDSGCWLEQPQTDPACSDPQAPTVALRGGGWVTSPAAMLTTLRNAAPRALYYNDVGFRCARGTP